MKYRLTGLKNFDYISENFLNCMSNAFAYCAEVLSRDPSMLSEGGPCLRESFEDENTSKIIYVVGWYYRDERFLSLQFKEVCRIEPVI